MRVHHIVEHSGPAALVLAEVAEPEAEGLVLIDVRAAGVSFAPSTSCRPLSSTPTGTTRRSSRATWSRRSRS